MVLRNFVASYFFVNLTKRTMSIIVSEGMVVMVGRPDSGEPDLGALVACLLFADGFEGGDEQEWSGAVY